MIYSITFVLLCVDVDSFLHYKGMPIKKNCFTMFKSHCSSCFTFYLSHMARSFYAECYWLEMISANVYFYGCHTSDNDSDLAMSDKKEMLNNNLRNICQNHKLFLHKLKKVPCYWNVYETKILFLLLHPCRRNKEFVVFSSMNDYCIIVLLFYWLWSWLWLCRHDKWNFLLNKA